MATETKKTGKVLKKDSAHRALKGQRLMKRLDKDVQLLANIESLIDMTMRSHYTNNSSHRPQGSLYRKSNPTLRRAKIPSLTSRIIASGLKNVHSPERSLAIDLLNFITDNLVGEYGFERGIPVTLSTLIRRYQVKAATSQNTIPVFSNGILSYVTTKEIENYVHAKSTTRVGVEFSEGDLSIPERIPSKTNLTNYNLTNYNLT